MVVWSHLVAINWGTKIGSTIYIIRKAVTFDEHDEWTVDERN